MSPVATLNADVVQTMEQEGCVVCVEVFRSAVKAASVPLNATFRNATTSDSVQPREFWERVIRVLGDRASQDFDYGMGAQSELADLTQPLSFSGPQGLVGIRRQRLLAKTSVANAFLETDTPCSSNGLCKFWELLANSCSYVREVLQLVYQVVNVVVHIITVIINALCGCLFVLNTGMCVLHPIVPTCGLVYSLYGAVWAQSVQLWSAVKKTTVQCQIHGDVLISRPR